MNKLTTKYLGLTLNTPLVVSSSGLTASVEKIARLAERGAGAVVLKSIFEEQILNETTHLEGYSAYPEAADYLEFYLKEEYLSQYIRLIRDAKSAVRIPVIASICCVAPGAWTDYARRIEEAGADALELNIFLLPTLHTEKAADIEARYLRIVQSVVSSVSIPVAVKLGARFTNPLNIIEGVLSCGARGVVLFNRFHEPDIDIDNLKSIEAGIFSTSAELRNALRWVGMASAAFPTLDIAASTGIHTGEDAAKALLAGARVCEICSAVYQQGPGVLATIGDFLTGWMERQGFESMDDVVGRLNYSRIKNPLAYERAQFMQYFGQRE